jgi:hypothetical protein
MPELIHRLLREVAGCLPEGAEVTLLADRGLAWPQVVDACGELGWHYVIRLQGQTRVRTADGQECTAAELSPCPGAAWRGEVEVFKKSGWPAAAVAACWMRDCDGPWLLVSDRDDGPAAVPAICQTDLDGGAVPGREVVGVPLGGEPHHRPGARGAAGAADRVGDVPGDGLGIAGDQGRAAAAAGVEPAADVEPVPDRLAVPDVLPEP